MIPGVRPLGEPGPVPLRLPCGFGPTLTVGGRTVQTRIVGGTLDDVLNGRPLEFAACARVRLEPGSARVTAAATDPYRIPLGHLLPGRPGAGGRGGVRCGSGAVSGGASATGTRARAATVLSWGPQQRRLRVASPADAPGTSWSTRTTTQAGRPT